MIPKSLDDHNHKDFTIPYSLQMNEVRIELCSDMPWSAFSALSQTGFNMKETQITYTLDHLLRTVE